MFDTPSNKHQKKVPIHYYRINTSHSPSDLIVRNIRASAKSGSSNVNCPALFGSSDGTCRITSDHTSDWTDLQVVLFICGIDDDDGTFAVNPTRGSPLDSRGEMTVEVSRERRIDSACIVEMYLLAVFCGWGYWRGISLSANSKWYE